MEKRFWNACTLTYQWKESGREGANPLLICLASSEEEAQACAALLEPQTVGAALAVVVVPQGEATWEEPLSDLLFSLTQTTGVDSCRVTLTGTVSRSGMVWRIASHRPRWFAGVCVVGGYGDPYAAREMRDVPLLVYLPQEEESRFHHGKLLAGAELLAAGLRNAGARSIHVEEAEETSPQELWRQAFSPEGKAVSWLLGQDRRTQFVVEWLLPGVWRIDDYFGASCYLVEGTDKALLIDTTMGNGDLPSLAASLTPLPVEVAITHPHLDHMHWLDRFQKVYLHQGDLEAVARKEDCFPGLLTEEGACLPELVPISHGETLDLGGDVAIQVLDFPGHTAHSVVFVDDSHRCFFTGDALGSGDVVLLICTDGDAQGHIARYRQTLKDFMAQMPRLSSYAWLGGHGLQENTCDPRHQQDYLQGRSKAFSPLRKRVLQDMITLCEKLLSGEIPWQKEPEDAEYHFRWKSAGINFRLM